MRPAPPRDLEELRARAVALAGHTVREVAEAVGMPVPSALARHKGFVGQVVEAALGASAGSQAAPDFPHLGVELKTLPVRPDGRPKESTYVCVAPLDGRLERSWESSWVRRKLACVLWVPVVGDGPADTRRLGTPVLWQPSAEEDAALRTDWELLTDLIRLGELWQLDARHGAVLQVRPKAQRASDTTLALDESGEWVADNPRGFYLRPSFTGAILARHLRLPGGR
jgi:DNA mismatch repair protein MutH